MAYTERNTTARKRELGDELRRARVRAGMTGLELAERLTWSTSKLSRIETGKGSCTEAEAAIILGYCRAPIEDVKRILPLCDGDEEGAWLQAFGHRLPDELRTLILSEATASEIHELEIIAVPGLLQIEDYARALIGGYGLVPEAGVEPRVRARVIRQGLLRGVNPPSAVFYIHEQALRLPVGGPKVMHEQLLHLMFLASLPRCVIRVIPTAAGPHPGMAGSFRLMRFAEHSPLVYRELENRGLILESSIDVATYTLILNKVAEVALSAGESRSMLAELASHFDRARAGDGEQGDLA